MSLDGEGEPLLRHDWGALATRPEAARARSDPPEQAAGPGGFEPLDRLVGRVRANYEREEQEHERRKCVTYSVDTIQYSIRTLLEAFTLLRVWSLYQ